MSRPSHVLRMLLPAALLIAAGCRPQQPFYLSHNAPNPAHYVDVGTDIEYPDAQVASLDEVTGAKPPLTLDNYKPDQMWDLSLEEAVKISLNNATVLRTASQANRSVDNLLRSPDFAFTVYGPAQTESDPQRGVEAALSAFDAQFATNVFWEKNDSPQNVDTASNPFRTDPLEQDLGTFQAQISKINATGGQMAVRHNVRYEWNNTNENLSNLRSRRWDSEWGSNVEVEITQPFLRGAGVAFNRIAGPGAVPGFNRGVMIARVQTDKSLTEFESAVRNHVSDVERTYWELYLAYRQLDTAITARDAALETWRIVRAKRDLGARGGGAQEEAQARQQYFTFRAQVEQGLNNLQSNETHLRYMLGLTSSDGRLIRPSDEPTTAKVDFDWAESHAEALVRYPELRRQKWRIKERELELIAAKNWLLPQVNGVARYRWVGLGDTLLDTDNSTRNAYGDMTDGNYQEWHLGVNVQFPFGFRREMAGVRNAQLNLVRERKVLQDQELEMTHLLAEAFRDVSSGYHLAQTFYDQRLAAKEEVAAARAAYDAGTTSLDLLLDAQRRLADAEFRYYDALVNYNNAITAVHFRKGSLLEYDGVTLAEGPWPAKAYFDVTRRGRHRDAGHYFNYGYSMPAVISQGPYNQAAGQPQFLPTDGGYETDAAPMLGPQPQALPAGPLTPPEPPEPPVAKPVPGLQGTPSATPATEPTPAGPGKTTQVRPRQLSQSAPVSQERYDVARTNLSVLATRSEQPSGWTAKPGDTRTAAPAAVTPTAHTTTDGDGWKKADRP